MLNILRTVLNGINDVKMDCDNVNFLVITSTVLPGDTRSKLISLVKNKKNFSKIKFCYSPEFIALGSVFTI